MQSSPVRRALVAILACFGGGIAAGDECFEWRRGPLISELAQPASSYDTLRHVTVVVGGGETWEWDGVEWELRATDGPSPRIHHALAFDAGRGVTVLFGGYDGADNAETWEWNGSEWTQLNVEGPPARYLHDLAYDAAAAEIVLFGGYATSEFGEYLDDTWTWDGQTWAQRFVSGPSARAAHAMTSTAGGGVVLFGGYIGDAPYYSDETWFWSAGSWTQSLQNGPSARGAHGLAAAESGSVVWLFGGETEGSDSAELWTLNSNGWSLAADQGPPAGAGAAFEFDFMRNRLVLFTGSQTWEWDGGSWSSRTKNVPAACARPGLTFDLARAHSVLTVGDSIRERFETWSWNGEDWTRYEVDGPPPRDEYVLAYDIANEMCMLFGGERIVGDRLGDTWGWNGDFWQLLASDGPAPREGHALAYDPIRQKVLLFGGRDNDLGFDPATWIWDGQMWACVAAEGPTPRMNHALAADPQRGVVVLFGGKRDTYEYYAEFFGDTWEWDGAEWTLKATDGPPSRHGATLVYDPDLQAVLLFGGMRIEWDARYLPHYFYYNDLWAWDGLTWNELQSAGPKPRLNMAGAFDSVRDTLVFFGGSEQVGLRADTWELGGPQIRRHPRSLNIATGESARLSIELDRGAAATYQWRRDGVPIHDDGRIVGADQAVLTIDRVQPVDAGTFDVIVTTACGEFVSRSATLEVILVSGDSNCDGEVTFDDIDGFVLALTGQAPYDELFPDCDRDTADLNNDGSVDFDDIDPFVAALIGK